jgi:hypothetical protein
MRRLLMTKGVPTCLTLLALAACGKDQQATPAQEPQAPVLSHSDRLLLAAAMIALPPAGVEPGDLPDPHAQGAQLEARYCAQCHALPAPTMHSATDWPLVARRMWLRMEWLPDSLGIRSRCLPSATRSFST